MRIDPDIKLDFKDVLFRPKRSTLSSRAQVNLEREYVFRNSKRTYKGVPVMAANMDTTGTFEMAEAFSGHGCFVAIHKHYSIEEWEKFIDSATEGVLSNIAVSAGSSLDDFERLKKILSISNNTIDKICLDVANGYSEKFVECVQRARQAFPSMTIIAGNVVTPEMTEELILSGADIIKVGIGPGSVCTTRKMTGVGYPQLSAVIECADAAHGLGGHVVSDGGCTCPGDVAKAFGAGADFVMLGGMFAGHDESGGEKLQDVNGKWVKEFYGMSSTLAMRKHSGGVANYRASEGKVVRVPYKGNVSSTLGEILGGVRSTCTYVGASSLKQLSKRTTFIRVTQQINNIFGTSDLGDAKNVPATQSPDKLHKLK